MYLSESEGDYYTCACGETTKHSYLISSRSGYITKCCKENGWDYFEYRGIWRTKRSNQTRDDVVKEANRYTEWVKSVDWNRYHTDPAYREIKSKEFRS